MCGCMMKNRIFTISKYIWKTKIMASIPITSWQIDGKQWKQWQALFSRAPKSLQMVTAAMKLKDVFSLEENFWQTQTAY